MQTSFSNLGLSADTLRALTRAGYEAPTPIQAGAIPAALQGRNVIGCAATGTGKTAAFMLPLLERAAGRKGTSALVLAPTRELAQQIAEYVDTFGKPRGVSAAVVVGGLGMGPQSAALRERRGLIIATPGRLIDHIDQGTADLSSVETLVLDEADRMLDMGFKPQLDRILSKIRRRKQTLLFSATMAGEVGKFASANVPDPVMIEIHRSGTTAERAEQRIFRVDRNEKGPLLLALLAEDEESTLVFVRTKHRADKIAKVVERGGHKVARIHGDRSQAQRRHALDGFKDGSYRVLVATDVAARGIDVEEIGHVINFDLPDAPEDYVHRIGRTARNAASGRATSFAEPEDKLELLAIEKLIGRQLPRAAVPRESPIFTAEVSRREENARNPGARGGRTYMQDGAVARPPSENADRRPQQRSESPDGGRRPPQRSARAPRQGGGARPGAAAGGPRGPGRSSRSAGGRPGFGGSRGNRGR